jgi:hypothetical protein
LRISGFIDKFAQSTALSVGTAVADIRRCGQLAAMILFKVSADRIAEIACSAKPAAFALTFSTQIAGTTVHAMDASIGYPAISALVGYNSVPLDFPADGRWSFSEFLCNLTNGYPGT